METLTREVLREELAPIKSKLDDLSDGHSAHRERMARLEQRVDALEGHPNRCPARKDAPEMRSAVGQLQVGHARMLGYFTGAGAVGGLVVALAGLIIKLVS